MVENKSESNRKITYLQSTPAIQYSLRNFQIQILATLRNVEPRQKSLSEEYGKKNRKKSNYQNRKMIVSSSTTKTLAC